MMYHGTIILYTLHDKDKAKETNITIELADVFEDFILGQVMVTVPPHGSAPHQV